MPSYLVERYVPGMSGDDVAEAARRTREAIEGTAAEETAVVYLGSAFLPAEDAVFCLFDAPNRETVAEVNALGGFAFDRIVDAVWIGPDGSAGDRRRERR